MHTSSSAAAKHDECLLQLAEAQRRLKVEEERPSPALRDSELGLPLQID